MRDDWPTLPSKGFMAEHFMAGHLPPTLGDATREKYFNVMAANVWRSDAPRWFKSLSLIGSFPWSEMDDINRRCR